MLGWIKNALKPKNSKKQIEPSKELIEAGFHYIQLVKSRIIEASFTEEGKLFYGDLKSKEYPLITQALCAYFAARTDYELEERGVSENIRDEIWNEIITAVYEEIGISSEFESIMKPLIANHMGLVRGMIETKGVTDYEAVATMLTIMSSIEPKNQSIIVNGVKEIKPSFDQNRVNAMLTQYEKYARYLDTIALESQSNG